MLNIPPGIIDAFAVFGFLAFMTIIWRTWRDSVNSDAKYRQAIDRLDRLA